MDGGAFVAHFGYDNPNATTVEPPERQNVFSPATREPRPADRVRSRAASTDAFQVALGRRIAHLVV